MFELLLYSSKLGRLEQWFDCSTILFGVSPSVLEEEFENLKQMVQIEIEEKSRLRSFHMLDSSRSNYNFDQMIDPSLSDNFAWIKELIPINSRKGKSL